MVEGFLSGTLGLADELMARFSWNGDGMEWDGTGENWANLVVAKVGLGHIAPVAFEPPGLFFALAAPAPLLA